MSTRIVVGEVNHGDNEPWAGAPVLFYLGAGQYNISTQYTKSLIETYTTNLGKFEIPLWVSDFDFNPITYTCCLPDGDTFAFVIPPGDEPINISLLRMSGTTNFLQPPHEIGYEIAPGQVTITQQQNLGAIAQELTIIPAVNSLTVSRQDCINFSYQSLSPLLLKMTKGNSRILQIAVGIDEPFDGVGCNITVGDRGNNQSIISTNFVDLTQTGRSDFSPSYFYEEQIAISLFLNASNSKTGSGFVYLLEA